MINIREYITGDAEKIFSLFSKYSNYQRDAAYWVWINRLLSEKKSIVVVAENSGDIIGHYAIIPRQCSVNGAIYNCGLGVHAFVDPNYRDQISIYNISAYSYNLAKQNNIDFLYGFPNLNYRLIQEKIERWKKVALFNSFVKKNNATIKREMIFSWKLLEEDDFNGFFALNEIIELSKDTSNIHLCKTLSYIINRYIRHPQKLYQIWLLEDKNEIIGYAVTKIFETDNEKKAHIIDYILISDSLINYLINDFETKFSEKVDALVLWAESEKTRETLINNSFLENGFETYFGIKILNKKVGKIEKELLDFSNWKLFMGDSDAF